MDAVQHIAFNCVDLPRQEAFYTRVFGFRRVRVFNPHASDEFIMLRLGSMCLELFSAPLETSSNVTKPPVGFQHLAFEVDDINEKVKELRAAGTETGDIVDCSDHVPEMRVCFFEDPEGNTVELMESWSDDSNPPSS